MEKRNLKEYKYVTFWKEGVDEEILFFTYAPKLEMTIEVARDIVASRLSYTGNQSVFTVIDVSNLKSTTKEARDYMSDPNGGLVGINAGAFLSNSVVTTVIINLFLKINKPSVPAKFFTSKDEALKWIRAVRKQQIKVV